MSQIIGNSKQLFIEKMKARTKKFAIDIIKLCEKLPVNQSTRVITYQLIKSSTSTGANYRAACRARSRAEFHSKMCIVVEEADETQYWIEVINESNIECDKNELKRLHSEISEILAIVTKAKYNT